MRSGQYRHSIAYERQSSAQDAAGQQVATWTQIGRDMADISPLSGTEYFSRSGEQTDVTTQIKVRYHTSLADVRADDRIVHGSTYYNIVSGINVGMLNKDFIFMCSTFRP